MRFITFTLAGALCLASFAAQATTYSFTGDNFTVIEELPGQSVTTNPQGRSYTQNDRVTGEFVTAEPLPANTTDIFLVSGQNPVALSYTFSDGKQTLASTDPNVGSEYFFVSTGANGEITAFTGYFSRIPPGEATGGDQTNQTGGAISIDSDVADDVFFFTCLDSACDDAYVEFAYSETIGQWAVDGAPVVTPPAPAPSAAVPLPPLALAGLAAALGAVGLRRRA